MITEYMPPPEHKLPRRFEKVPLIEAGKLNIPPHRTASGYFSPELQFYRGEPVVHFTADPETIRPRPDGETAPESSFYLSVEGLRARGYTIAVEVSTP